MVKYLKIILFTVSIFFVFNSCREAEPIAPKYTSADFVHFECVDMLGAATIDRINKTIFAVVNDNVDITNLIVVFVLADGAKAYIDDVLQVNGETKNDFSKAVKYTVISGDGKKKEYWEVTIAQDYMSINYELGGVFNQNIILPAATFLVKKDIEIGENVYFEIKPNTTFKLYPNVKIIANPNSKFIARGKEYAPIKFICKNDVCVIGEDAWDNITFNQTATVELEYCEFENGTSSGNPLIVAKSSSLGVLNCTVNNVLHTGFYIDGNSNFRVFKNNEINNCAEKVAGCYPIYFEDINTISSLSGDNKINTIKGIYIKNSNVQNHLTIIGQSCPFILADDFNIDVPNVAVLVHQGVSFIMNEGKKVNIAQNNPVRVEFDGDTLRPITFTSVNPIAGNWEGFTVGNKILENSHFNFCNIMYAGNGSNTGAIKCSGTSNKTLKISNCMIDNTKSHGIYFTFGSSAALQDNTINVPIEYENIFYE